MASSGHLRRCGDAVTSNKYLSRAKDASILSRPTIMSHLRRCSDAVTSNKYLSRTKDASILSWPTTMGHYKQLIAIFTASPTTLWRCRYVQQILDPYQRCFYTITANYYGSLQALDCHIHSVRYDMVLEYRFQPYQIGPHQVTYDVVAMPLRPTNT
eukprot:scaffold23824_cov78-Skeletonema_dohrnii-CCMP3373.AAC.1